jgi:hypothetical protein
MTSRRANPAKYDCRRRKDGRAILKVGIEFLPQIQIFFRESVVSYVRGEPLKGNRRTSAEKKDQKYIYIIEEKRQIIIKRGEEIIERR